MGIKTQGTQLYMLLPSAGGTGNEVVQIECTTSITLGGAPRDQIEDTCLDETEARSYLQGLGTPASSTVALNADPRNASHKRLHDLLADGTVVAFALGWSDGKDIAPTLNTAGDDFELPATRTWNVFKGFVSDFPFDFQGNAVVSTTCTVQRSGASLWIPKTATTP